MSPEVEWCSPTPSEKAVVAALIRYQFGVDPQEVLPEFEVSRSRKTGRIRYIGVNSRHVATIRATDGLLVPGEPLARILARKSEYTVAVEDDAASYIREGRTVFAKHVVHAGAPIRPGDEVVVTDSSGTAVALGRAVLPGPDMVVAKRGKAVKTRRGLRAREEPG